MLNMIGTMEFIKCAGSLATAEYPLLTADSDMDTYVVMKYENVHFIEDMRQTVTMPSFDGWSGCNIVRFKESGTDTPWIAYYWITDAMRSSTSQGSTDFMLEFDAPTTLLKKGDKVNGQWLRSPVNFTPWKQQNVISGTMGYEATNKRFELSAMPSVTGGKMLWVSITATKSADNTQGALEIYGFPILVKEDTIIPSYDWLVNYVEDGTVKSFCPLSCIKQGATLWALGLTASEIQDISITSGCPYPCTYDSNGFNIQSSSYRLKAVYIQYSDGDTTKTAAYPVYHITGGQGSQPKTVEYVSQKTVTLTDMEMTCGEFNILDSSGTVVYNIPSNWIQNNKLGFETRVICDFSQIYWRIEVKEVNSSGSFGKTLGVFMMNEGHIPYIGSQWDDYRAYSMSYDRESVQFANDQAKQQAIANAVSSVASFQITKPISSLINIGASAASAYMGYEQTTRANNFNQNLSERRTQSQPGNAYGLNYGLGYVVNAYKTPNSLVVSLPVGITEDIFNEFIENFGYANEGEYEMPMDYGFYQGTIYTTPDMTGPRLVELINAMNAGIRMIKPSGNTKG